MQKEIFIRIGKTCANLAEEERRAPRAETAQLSAALRELKRRYDSLPEEGKSPAEAWLCDNGGFILEEGEAAQRTLLRVRALHTAGRESALGSLCRMLVACGAGKLSEEEIGCAVDAYNESAFLPEEELSLLPAMLVCHIAVWLAEAYRKMDGVRERENRYLPGISRAVTALHALRGGELRDLVAKHDRVERILSEDGEGLYPRLDVRSRAAFRGAVSRFARQCGERPDVLARHLVENGELCARLQKLSAGKSWRGRAYFLLLGGLTAAVWALFCLAAPSPALAILSLLPAHGLARGLCDFFVLRYLRPAATPRLSLPEGIPPEGKTLCVITSLITSPADAVCLARRLREFRAANRNCGENLLFGLLLDFRDAPKAHMPEDDALRAAAEGEIDRLKEEGMNALLFLRQREYAATEGRFMGKERKRGALAELFDALRGEGGLPVYGGELPGDIRYVLTLDADTRAEPYSILPLVATLCCPVNRPRISGGRVVSGYGMAMPRIVTDLAAVHKSPFARLTGGVGGCDAYGSVSSDLYMDLFGAASFTGKGLIDVDAYRACLGDLPAGRILSHDLLESGYLSCALVNDTEMTDGCPHRVQAYFTRLRRWIRGDVQIAAWAGRRIPCREGGRKRNPLDGVTRYKIFDNVRRAMTAPAVLCLALAALAARRGEALFVLAMACVILPELFGALAGEMGRGLRVWRFYSAAAAGLWAAIARAAVEVWLLPVRAWTSVSAVVCAVRGILRGKGMLAWVTAAEAESAGQDAASLWRLCFPGVVSGIFALRAGGLGIPVGILWMLSFVAVTALSAPCRTEYDLRPETEARLRAWAEEIWHYFRDMLRPEEGFLIPDNLQEEPSAGIAHRTSPTDIGFGISAVICAMDLSFVEEAEGMRLISGQLDALERQKKWRGHIYNWVDTRTQRPLPPYQISTVDSGNLAAALLLLYAYAEERGGAFAELGARAMALFRGMDFRALYDGRRELFSIGADGRDNSVMPSCYDLLASEARLTGFIAAAFGAAGEKFWGRLGRGLVGHRGYAGLASWTGSAFEYLMPELYLPLFENSLIAESTAFCVAAQRRYRPAGSPLWGTSESAYRAFDRSMVYQYKAHGVPGLALRRGMGKETVLSPYSVFLCLPYAPRDALRCLAAFEKAGLRGRYGFYEAADFTPARTGGRAFEPVATYMSHHMGMSLMSLHLMLTRGKNPARMMRIPEISAFAGLLKERLPVGANIMRRHSRETFERKNVYTAVEFARETAGNPADPEGCLFGNGAYTLAVDERGLGTAFFEGVGVYRPAGDLLCEPGGIRAWFTAQEEKIPVHTERKSISRRCVRCGNVMTFESSSGNLGVVAEVFVSRNHAAEIREYKLVNRGDNPVTGRFTLAFEPMLCPAAEYEAHPTYRRLFVRTEIAGGAALASRRQGERRLWLAFALEGADVRYETSRETLLGRRGYDPDGMRFAQSAGDVLDPVMAAQAEITLPPGGDVVLRAVISVAWERGAALRALGVRHERADALPAGARRGGDARRHAEAQRLSARLFGAPRGKVCRDALPDGAYAALWKLGIAGDVPLILSGNRADGGAEEFPLFCYAMYRRAGLSCEMAVLTDDGEGYFHPGKEAVLEKAAEFGLTEASGLHILSRNALSEGELRLLSAAAALDFTVPFVPGACSEGGRLPPFGLPGGEALPEPVGELSAIPAAHMTPVVWSMPLANRSFGCIAEDVGPGGMWYRNARLYRLTHFSMDPLGGNLAERLTLSDGVHEMSLFKDGIHPCAVRFDLGCAVWEKAAAGLRVRTRMFVPPKVPLRIMLVEGYAEREIRLAWQLRPLLGEKEADRAYLTVLPEALGGAVMQNAGGIFFPGEKFTCLASGRVECSPPSQGGDARMELSLAPVSGAFCFVLLAGMGDAEGLLPYLSPGAAEKALSDTQRHFAARTATLWPDTPERMLDAYLSGACLYQVLASRIYAKASLWQCGGGSGFRDQLQDICALVHFDAPLAREVILTAAARQYEEGDVMHWWHDLPDGVFGVRTRCSDDLLWLPYAVFEYVNVTGDAEILDETVPYLSSAVLEDGEESRCERPGISRRRESLLLHCVRACDTVSERGLGRHGLPLMLSGDWNDGMDRVGAEGRGESVWLGFFAAHVYRKTALLCRRAGMEQKAEELGFFAGGMANAALDARAEGHYIRAFWDDGSPLGGGGEGACAIDSIAQSFSTWVPEGRKEEKRAACLAAANRLWDEEGSYLRLLTPPFAGEGKNPGYIADYPPGIRENGGQYTHAAVWLCMALFSLGEEELGMRMLLSLLPAKRREDVRKCEDFVLSGDVYDHPDHRGRSGWSWYTGAAGWYMQAVLRCLFGLRHQDGVLSLFPYLPKGWEGYSFIYPFGGGRLHVSVRRGSAPGIYREGDPIENALRPEDVRGDTEILAVV
ncbi:MAG: hypothetical protein IKL89_01935 [Clostridia bacterium]|nr:hypothetical protein [Clostridia bacterium]